MASCWQVGLSSKNVEKPKENQGFLVLRPSNFEAKFNKKRTQTDQNSSKKLVSILIQFLMHLGTNLGRFWEDFGGQVGAKLGQNGSKTRSQKQFKNHHVLGALRRDFWWILGPNMPPKRGPQKLIFGGFLLLGAILEPRWPQDPPRPLQEASWI